MIELTTTTISLLADAYLLVADLMGSYAIAGFAVTARMWPVCDNPDCAIEGDPIIAHPIWNGFPLLSMQRANFDLLQWLKGSGEPDTQRGLKTRREGLEPTQEIEWKFGARNYSTCTIALTVQRLNPGRTSK